MKRNNINSSTVTLQQFTDPRHLIMGKIQDPLPKFRIEILFYPRKIFTDSANTGSSTFQTKLRRIVQENNRIAMLQPCFQSTGIISINDPYIPGKHFCKRGIKLFPCYSRPILLMPQPVQIDQRKSGQVPQLSCKSAFSRTRAANNNYFIHYIPYL